MQNRACISRLSRYRNAVKRLKMMNFIRVFSDNLADAAGVTSAQVRKDFSLFGISGNRRGGYHVEELLEQLNKILLKDKLHKFILIGVGNIGRALLGYPGFESNSIRIVAAFDIDPAKYNSKARVPVLSLSELRDYIENNDIRLGIITVPDFAARQVFELMKSAGIKGVLNFAPICLQEYDDCIVQNINFETELSNIIYFVNHQNLGINK